MNSYFPSDAPQSVGGRRHRSARNYLLDPKFQLKYTGFLVLIALLLSVGLGAQLWVTSKAVIEQSQRAVAQGQMTVHRGKLVIDESKKVSAVVTMSIAKDPGYADNPELAALFQEGAASRDSQLLEEVKRLESDALALEQQSAYLSAQQRRTFYVLLIGLSLLVVAIGFVGIIFTHKVAGPVHRMKALLRRVAAGRLNFHEGLRRGDELQPFFDAFLTMVESLRKLETSDAERLAQAIANLETSVSADKLEELRKLRIDIEARLNA